MTLGTVLIVVGLDTGPADDQGTVPLFFLGFWRQQPTLLLSS